MISARKVALTGQKKYTSVAEDGNSIDSGWADAESKPWMTQSLVLSSSNAKSNSSSHFHMVFTRCRGIGAQANSGCS